MGVGLEHVGREAAPHHQLDHALRYVLFDEVGDTGMAEDMRGNMLLDSGPLRKALELHGHGPVGKCCLVFGDEDRHFVRNRFCRVIVLPFCQGLAGHDEPDVPWLTGLEVHIRDDAPLVEGKVAPFHPPDLADAEPAFVEHHDDGPVAAAGAGADHRGDLFGREQVRGDLGHGLVMRGLEGLEFLFRDCDVLVLDEPEVELFEDDHVVGDRVLHELPAPLAPAGFQCRNAGIECGHIVFLERADEASPADKCVRNFIRTLGAGVAG